MRRRGEQVAGLLHTVGILVASYGTPTWTTVPDVMYSDDLANMSVYLPDIMDTFPEITTIS